MLVTRVCKVLGSNPQDCVEEEPSIPQFFVLIHKVNVVKIIIRVSLNVKGNFTSLATFFYHEALHQ